MFRYFHFHLIFRLKPNWIVSSDSVKIKILLSCESNNFSILNLIYFRTFMKATKEMENKNLSHPLDITYFLYFILFCIFLQTSVTWTQSRHSQELIIFKVDKYLSFDQSLLTFYSFNICLFFFFFQKKKKKKRKRRTEKLCLSKRAGEDKLANLANFHARGHPRQTEPHRAVIY